LQSRASQLIQPQRAAVRTARETPRCEETMYLALIPLPWALASTNGLPSGNSRAMLSRHKPCSGRTDQSGEGSILRSFSSSPQEPLQNMGVQPIQTRTTSVRTNKTLYERRAPAVQLQFVKFELIFANDSADKRIAC
jgi:hypothetical protein